MRSLKDNFEELRLRLGHGRGLSSTGSDPIFYLVFPVAQILEVKRQTKAWVAKLANEGWHVVTLSMTDVVERVLQDHKLRKVWLLSEKSLLDRSEKEGKPLDTGDITKTLSKALSDGSQLSPALLAMVQEALDAAHAAPNGLLLITDLEALHPYLRINTIEAYLHGKVQCPVVVLYPGVRVGKTSLRFLEIYPADPNYRSDHIG
jgi:hypothetical protein